MAIKYTHSYQKVSRVEIQGEHTVRVYYNEIGVFANGKELVVGEMSKIITPDMDLSGDDFWCTDEVREICDLQFDEDTRKEWSELSEEEKIKRS
jgi:hypothetical protein